MRFHVIGFGLCTGWLWLFFLQGPLLEQAVAAWGKQGESLFLLFLLSHSIGSALIGFLPSFGSLAASSKLLTICATSMSMLPLVLACLPLFFPLATAFGWLTYLLAALSGLFAAPLFVAWAERFSRLTIAAAATALAVGLCIAGLLTITATWLDPLTGFAVLALLAPLSLALMRRIDRDCPRPEICLIDTPVQRVFPARLIALIALLYIAGGLMFKTITLEQSFPYFFYISNLAYMGVCLLGGLALRYRPALDLRLIYRPVLPLVGIGFLIFPLSHGQFAGLSYFLLQSGLALFDMYTWLLIAYVARFHARPAAVCGYGLSIITFAIFGGALAYTLVIIMTQTLPRLDYLSFGAGIACLLASLFFPEDRETFAGWHVEEKRPTASTVPVPTSTPAATAAPAGYTADDIAECGGVFLLTPREREVLTLLVKGWNSRSIAEKLNISTNTVKFHTRNIYSKCGVNDRQELLKFLDK